METAGIESLQRIKGYRLEPNTYCKSKSLYSQIKRQPKILRGGEKMVPKKDEDDNDDDFDNDDDSDYD